MGNEIADNIYPKLHSLLTIMITRNTIISTLFTPAHKQNIVKMGKYQKINYIMNNNEV